MWEWLINNHPVNTTISSLLQLMGTKRLGWLYPLNETAGLSMNWHVVSSSLASTHVPPLYSWINLSKSFLFFSRNPPSNCSKKWDASSFPMMALWPGVPLSWRNSSASLSSSTNKGISSFASTCNLTGSTLLKGRWLSCPRITHVDHKQLYAFCPNSAANFSCWLTHQTTASHLLIWAGQMSFDGMPSSFPRLRTEAPSFSVRERFAAGVNPEAISEIGTKWQW